MLTLAACATAPSSEESASSRGDSGAPADARAVRVVNRITWGVNGSAMRAVSSTGLASYVQDQLHPAGDATLPPEVNAQIASMGITKEPLPALVTRMEELRKANDGIKDDVEKKAAQEAYQQQLTLLGREAATRSLLRAIYSPQQLREHMTWFWMNHFNVHQYKANVRVLVGDYEDRAIRPRALGRFRDLLGATLRHPAMIRYLDNEQNAANRVNENYARELLELHTLGVDGGYTQKDVQELARILTGIGINLTGNPPRVKAEWQSMYVRDGLFEFNPNRHDFGDKVLLGRAIRGRGLGEVDEALDVLAKHPSTARFVGRKLATFFVADDPPPELVKRLAATFQSSDGDIASVLAALFDSPEFARSLGTKFKDPVHYAVSAVRLAYDDKPILNAGPIIGWLNRMGEALYNRQTPDGFPLTESAWSSSGQMATRFEIARSIGSGAAGLFKTEGPAPAERPAFPKLANALYYQSIERSLGPQTRDALDKAASPQEWNVFLLSSPDFMFR